MNNSVFVLFWCDAWHSHSSKRIGGIYEDFQQAFDGATELSENSEEGKLSIDDDLNLRIFNQTQNRSENYIIEEWELNKTI